MSRILSTPHSSPTMVGDGWRPILVVDDDDCCRHSIERALRRRGFTVCGASNGMAALAIYDAVQPELVVTDIVMPSMDGTRLIDALMQRDPGVAILAVTGLPATDGRVQHLLNRDGVTVLLKPFDEDDLDDAIRCVGQTP